MRKNKMMRLASVLLVITMLTTCTISGTFAKYVTQDSADDTARVAKWGIEVLASGNLFGTDYAENDGSATADTIVAATSTSVSSSDTKDIVAPGTKNTEGFTLKLTGEPEVAYELTAKTGSAVAGKADNSDIYLGAGYWGVLVEATGLNAATDYSKYYLADGSVATGSEAPGTKYYELHDTVTLGDDYYPLNWTVTAVPNVNLSAFAAIATTKNIATIATAMVTDLNDKKADANDNAEGSYKLTWVWPYSTNETNDKADTILGNLFDGNSDAIVVYSSDGSVYSTATTGHYCLDINFAFELTVTQVD